ncbi:hypothetical protein RDV84_16815 [Lysobacter yananisis]|uniref:Uncharacterized protein n=1 Tax=Lysobacter yananisis TaxID=1003114 RepID=A0ABY9P6Z7_9GAMM|nr:hypothetical protein [Lysobacter yananisis]WMT01632.1 hypothetical protein RDV84_16815 [Lysobacter yananisis]
MRTPSGAAKHWPQVTLRHSKGQEHNSGSNSNSDGDGDGDGDGKIKMDSGFRRNDDG